MSGMALRNACSGPVEEVLAIFIWMPWTVSVVGVSSWTLELAGLRSLARSPTARRSREIASATSEENQGKRRRRDHSPGFGRL